MQIDRPNQPANLFQFDHSMMAGDGAGDDAGKLGKGGLFVIVNVRVVVTDKLSAAITVNPDRDLIRHRTAGHEDRGLFPEDFRGRFFQPIDRRIDIDQRIANFGRGDRLPHFGGGTRYSVASQIDHVE